MMTVTDPQRKRILTLHYEEGMSIVDISQKLNLKKHLVEGVLKGVSANTEPLVATLTNTPIDTPTDTPATREQPPSQQPPLDTVSSVRERELALELRLLQEQNRQKELAQQLAELHYQEAVRKEQTERERIKGLHGLAEKRLATEKFKVAAAHKQQLRQEQATLLAQPASQVKVKDLTHQVKLFLQPFASLQAEAVQAYYVYEITQYATTAQQLLREVKRWFPATYKDLLHYQALLAIRDTFESDLPYGWSGKHTCQFSDFDVELFQVGADENSFLGEVVGDWDE